MSRPNIEYSDDAFISHHKTIVAGEHLMHFAGKDNGVVSATRSNND